MFDEIIIVTKVPNINKIVVTNKKIYLIVVQAI